VELFVWKGGAKELLLAMRKGESVFLMNDQKFNRGALRHFLVMSSIRPLADALGAKFGTYIQPVTVKRLLHKGSNPCS